MDSDGGSSGQIVVATDGSSAAQSAAALAVDWASALGSPVRAIYIVDSSLVWHEFADYRRELGFDGEEVSREEAIACFEEQGDLALQWIEQRCRTAGVPVSCDLLLGGIADVVLQRAGGSRLLAAGKRGQAHAHDAGRLGSHLRSIAHHAPVPLLVAGEDTRQVRRLLLVTENGLASPTLLDWTMLLRDRLAAEVVVLYVSGEREGPHGALEGALAQFEHAVCPLSDNVADDAGALAIAAAEHRADLILVAKDFHHHSLRERLAERATDRIVADTPLPVLLA